MPQKAYVFHKEFMSLRFNSAQRGGIINIITYCEECVAGHMFISKDGGAHLSERKARQNSSDAHGLVGVCRPQQRSRYLDALVPACPSRLPEPTSPPPPMQQCWSGLRGSSFGGSGESLGAERVRVLVPLHNLTLNPERVVLLQARRLDNTNLEASAPCGGNQKLHRQRKDQKKDAEKRGLPSSLRRFHL